MSPTPQAIHLLDWAAIVLYGLAMLMIPLYHARRMRRQDDLFLSGRSMSRWPVAISMYMALFSTNSFIGLIGWLNRPAGTVWILLQNVGIIAAVPLVVLLFPALFYRLRVTTAYEYLDRRFNYSVRAFASLFFMGARIMWMATMLYAASLVIAQMLGWTAERGVEHGLLWAILLTGVLATFVALVGGMRAIIWTDVIQFFVVMFGVAAMAYLTIRDSGGLGNVIDVAQEAGKFRMPAAFSLTDDLSLLSGFLLGFIAYLSNGGADQLILQTYLSGKSEREIKASLWRNGFILKPLSVIFPILGLLTFVYYHEHPDIAATLRIPDDALPVFVVNVLPAGIRGLMIAAILSAMLSSLSGGTTALSATLQVDFIRRHMKTPLSDHAAMTLGRWLTLLWGVVIVVGAICISRLGKENNIIQILNIVMYPFVGVLLGIFLLALLNHRANSQGTLIGAAAGFVVTIAFPMTRVAVKALTDAGAEFSTEFVSRVNYLGQISNFFYGFLGFLTTMLLGSAVSHLFPPPRPEQIHGLTRRDMPAPID